MRGIFLLYFILRSNVRFVLFLMSLADIDAVKSLCVRSLCDCLDMQIYRSMLSNLNFIGRNIILKSALITMQKWGQGVMGIIYFFSVVKVHMDTSVIYGFLFQSYLNGT